MEKELARNKEFQEIVTRSNRCLNIFKHRPSVRVLANIFLACVISISGSAEAVSFTATEQMRDQVNLLGRNNVMDRPNGNISQKDVSNGAYGVVEFSSLIATDGKAVANKPSSNSESASKNDAENCHIVAEIIHILLLSGWYLFCFLIGTLCGYMRHR